MSDTILVINRNRELTKTVEVLDPTGKLDGVTIMPGSRVTLPAGYTVAPSEERNPDLIIHKTPLAVTAAVEVETAPAEVKTSKAK